MARIFYHLFDFCFIWIKNVFVAFVNLFIWRDKKIWMFGAWMGEKFADNPRFLFQYLYDNKEKYDIKKIVWVTRSKKVLDEMSTMGYEAYLVKSIKGIYYHLKSGVHIVCNNVSSKSYPYDIIPDLSFTAKKIQLWHGVGIKACGKLVSTAQTSAFKTFVNDKVLHPYGLPGMWGKCYFLATSDENERVAIEDYGMNPNRIIRGIYPRLCKCISLKKEETDIIDLIQRKKEANYSIVLYLPTFRKNDSDYVNPESMREFSLFLNKNDILWIRKKHSADGRNDLNLNDDHVISLESNFDINVIYEYIDLLITDYSSAASDAVYWEKNTLEYCPDYSDYKDEDRGFVAPFEKYHVYAEPIMDPSALYSAIVDRLECGPNITKVSELKSFLYSGNMPNMDILMKSIVSVIKNN